VGNVPAAAITGGATWAVVQSRFGAFQLFGNEEAVTRLILPGTSAGPPATGGGRGGADAPELLWRAARQLEEYLGGGRRTFDVPLRPVGTPFQQEVWRGLRAVGYGRTVTYAELAALIGRPTAVRAVGQANAANPIPIFLPCHRVVASGGQLGGYAGGTALKQALLGLEAVAVPPGRRT